MSIRHSQLSKEATGIYEKILPGKLNCGAPEDSECDSFACRCGGKFLKSLSLRDQAIVYVWQQFNRLSYARNQNGDIYPTVQDECYPYELSSLDQYIKSDDVRDRLNKSINLMFDLHDERDYMVDSEYEYINDDKRYRGLRNFFRKIKPVSDHWSTITQHIKTVRDCIKKGGETMLVETAFDKYIEIVYDILSKTLSEAIISAGSGRARMTAHERELRKLM
jgi:hypothetical protein